MTGPLLPAEASSMAYPTTEATPFGLAHRRSIANEAARECYCPIGVSDPILWPRTARQEPGVLVPGLTGGRSSPDRSRHRAGSDPVRGRCLSVQRLDPPVEAWVSAQGPLRPAQPVARLGIEVGERHRQRCGHAAVCCEPVGRVLAASASGQAIAQTDTVHSTNAVVTWPRWTACTTATMTPAATTSPSSRIGCRRPTVTNPTPITNRDAARRGSASHIVSNAQRAALVA
jgi:hypothetical protein